MPRETQILTCKWRGLGGRRRQSNSNAQMRSERGKNSEIRKELKETTHAKGVTGLKQLVTMAPGWHYDGNYECESSIRL